MMCKWGNFVDSKVDCKNLPKLLLVGRFSSIVIDVAPTGNTTLKHVRDINLLKPHLHVVVTRSQGALLDNAFVTFAGSSVSVANSALVRF